VPSVPIAAVALALQLLGWSGLHVESAPQKELDAQSLLAVQVEAH